MMARYQEKVHGWAGWLGKKIPLVERLVIPQLDALLRGLSVLVNPRRFLVSFGWIALSWLIAVAEYYVMIYALNPRAPFWWGAFVDSVLALGIAVPSAPGALGVFEAAMVGALSLLGFSASIGLAYAVILHFMQWVITAIFGLLGLMQEGRSLSSFFSDISRRVTSRSAPKETSE
jgi:uncharacterized protein (TIRG00374 family)